jgi:hypothetical protein
MARTVENETSTGRFSGVVSDVRQKLTNRLDSGNDLVKLERDDALDEFGRVATAFVLVVQCEPPEPGLVPGDSDDQWVETFVRSQLEKECGLIASNAEARATHREKLARDTWRGRLDAARRYKR